MKPLPTHPQYHLSVAQIKRSLTRYLKRFDDCARRTQETYLLDLLNFLSFMERQLPHSKGFWALSEADTMEWMRRMASGRKATRVAQLFLCVEHFLNALHDEGTLFDNPMAQIKARFGKQGWVGMARALRSADPAAALEALRPEPGFTGRFGQEADAYTRLHSPTGETYRLHRLTLVEFNRFLARRSLDLPTPISADTVQAWIDGMSCTPRQRLLKLFILKRFLSYLAGAGAIPNDPITDEMLDLLRVSKHTFTPYLFSTEQIRALLEAATTLTPNLFLPLKPQMMYTLIALLYTLGLRLGEALSLRIQDIDWDQNTLFLAKTKYYKERLLPFGPKLSRCLKRYLEARRRLEPHVRPKDRLFVGRRGRPLVKGGVLRLFRLLMQQAQIVMVPERPRPRLHDLRHTFAVHRLLRWYKEQVDVQVRLPLLSTFMGHFKIYSTQVYLTITDPLREQALQRFHDPFGIPSTHGEAGS